MVMVLQGRRIKMTKNDEAWQAISEYPLFKYLSKLTFDEWDAEEEAGTNFWDDIRVVIMNGYEKKELEKRL